MRTEWQKVAVAWLEDVLWSLYPASRSFPQKGPTQH